MIILDLESEVHPLYGRLQSYYGQPFIWNMLHDFGGTVPMYGAIESINNVSTVEPVIYGHSIRRLGSVHSSRGRRPILRAIQMSSWCSYCTDAIPLISKKVLLRGSARGMQTAYPVHGLSFCGGVNPCPRWGGGGVAQSWLGRGYHSPGWGHPSQAVLFRRVP